MNTHTKLAVVVFSVLVFAVPAISFAQADNPKWEEVWIPAKDSKFFGGVVDVKLQATLYKPEGPGPHPVLILNHGSTGPGAVPANQTFRGDPANMKFYIGRGFVVLLPMRRGRGQSEGSYDESYTRDFRAGQNGMKRAMEDMDAVLAFAKTLPFVDSARVVMGESLEGEFSRLFTRPIVPELSLVL
jgi:predicted acyl esterase